MRLFVSIVVSSLALSNAFGQKEPMLKSDFSNVANFTKHSKVYTLSNEQITLLRRNHFVVTPSDDIQLNTIYAINDYANFPSLVTTDNVLQLFHVFFDSTLRHLEEHHLNSELKSLNGLMLKQARRRYHQVSGSNLSEAALKNLEYFGVADRLLGGKADLPTEAATIVAKEVELVQDGRGVAESPIFPYAIDYSQFIVRGHYSRSTQLRRYFKTLMWFGLVPLAIEMTVPGGPIPNLVQTRQAALMVQDLYDSGAINAWNRIYSVTSMYVGNSNDLTPDQWRTAVKPVLGWPQALGKLNNQANVLELASAVKKACHPLIVNKARNRTATGEVQFRFMGQRAIEDSIVFNRLTSGLREWPSSLDVAIAFGSQRAAQIVDANLATYNPKGWKQYLGERNKIVSEISRWTSSQWNGNLYNGCLDLIRLNLKSPDSRAPQFMQNSAWADKSIASNLAFWAELRHDTVLYGMQTSAEQGDGDEQPFVKGYVEPNADLYSRLKALLRQTQDGLTRFKYLQEKEVAQFEEFRDLVEFLRSASLRELTGGKLTKDEHWRIRKLEGDLSGLTDQIQLIGETYNTLSQDDLDMALVADVHTVRDEALAVASGHSDDLLAVVPIEGKLTLARGSVLSFYEFKVPTSKRMIDHDWKNQLREHKAPPRPTWISTYFVNKSSRGKE